MACQYRYISLPAAQLRLNPIRSRLCVLTFTLCSSLIPQSPFVSRFSRNLSLEFLLQWPMTSSISLLLTLLRLIPRRTRPSKNFLSSALSLSSKATAMGAEANRREKLLQKNGQKLPFLSLEENFRRHQKLFQISSISNSFPPAQMSSSTCRFSKRRTKSFTLLLVALMGMVANFFLPFNYNLVLTANASVLSLPSTLS